MRGSSEVTSNDGAAPGDLLVLEGADSQVRIAVLSNGNAAVVSVASPVGDGANQDGAATISHAPNVSVLAVADGVGGARAGASAARQMLETLAESVSAVSEKDAQDPELMRATILSSIEEANRRILASGSGGATTVTIAQVVGRDLRTFQVGDSVSILVGQKGKLKYSGIPHGPVVYAVEAGVLDEHEAINHEERHVVSNVVGDQRMHIDIGPAIQLSSKDTLLLASDGVYDNMFLNEILETVRKGSLEESSTRLVERSRARMEHAGPTEPSKPDDLTFIIFRPS